MTFEWGGAEFVHVEGWGGGIRDVGGAKWGDANASPPGACEG